MENTTFSSIEEVDDISTLDEYQVALNAGLKPEEALQSVAGHSRDNARTPMQWSDAANAGFTTGTPWLKVNPNYTSINAAAQMEDPDSVRSVDGSIVGVDFQPGCSGGKSRICGIGPLHGCSGIVTASKKQTGPENLMGNFAALTPFPVGVNAFDIAKI